MKEKCSQTGTVMEIVFIYVFRWTTCSCNRTCCFCIRLVFHAFSMMHRSGFFEAWQCRKIKLNHFFRIRDPAMLGMYKLIQNLCFWVNCTRSNCNLHPLSFPPAVIFRAEISTANIFTFWRYRTKCGQVFLYLKRTQKLCFWLEQCGLKLQSSQSSKKLSSFYV